MTEPSAGGRPPSTPDAAARAATVSGLFGRDMIYLVTWATQLVLTAAMTPLITRLMVPSEFGRVMAATAVMQLLNALLGFGLDTAVQRAYHGEHGEEDAQRLITLSCALAACGGLIIYFTGRWWAPVCGLGSFDAPVQYAVIWGVFAAVTGPPLSLLRSRDQLAWFAVVNFAQSLFAQALAVVLISAVHNTASEYMLGQLIGQVVTVAVAVAVARPRLISHAHRTMLIRSLQFSVMLVPALVAGFLSDTADRLVIHGDLGATALGHYAVARNIGGFAAVMLGLLDFVWLPRLFGIDDPDTQRKVLTTSRDGLYVLAGAFAVAIAAASPVLLRAWAPASYHPSSLLLVTALVAANSVPAAGGMVYGQALILAGRTKAIATIAGSLAVVSLGLNLLLVPSLGISGSAGITVVAATAGLIAERLALGRAAPRQTLRGMLLVLNGVAICIASAAIPSNGIGLAGRMLLAVIAGIVFCARLVTLAWPETQARFDRRLVQLRTLIPVGRIDLMLGDPLHGANPLGSVEASAADFGSGEPVAAGERAQASLPAPSLGLVVLAHHLPEQLAALLAVLRHPRVAVYLHLDLKAEPKPFIDALAAASIDDVTWIKRRRTRWGGVEVVDAEIDGIAHAVADGCGYVMVISGEDFPLRPIDELVAFAEANSQRSFVDASPLPVEAWEFGGRDRVEFYNFRIGRHLIACVPWGEDTSWMEPRRRALNWILRGATLVRPKRHLPDYVVACGGSHWSNLSADAARYLLDFMAAHPDYRRYHEHTMCADEVLIQSVIAGTEFADGHEVINDDLRFVLWAPEDPSHPKRLTAGDLPALLASDALFARKVNGQLDPELLAVLRERVAGPFSAV